MRFACLFRQRVNGKTLTLDVDLRRSFLFRQRVNEKTLMTNVDLRCL